MTIDGKATQRRKLATGGGKKPKIRPPPPSGQASGVVPSLVQADDLWTLAVDAGLSHVPSVDLSASAERINDHFAQYSEWKRVDIKAPPLVVSKWCTQGANLAADMRHTLGHDSLQLLNTQFLDAMQHLISVPQDSNTRYKLERLLREALPEEYAKAEREGEGNLIHVIAWLCLQRLNPILEILELLARRGTTFHTKRSKRRGKKPEIFRKHLFHSLAGEYQALFARLPAGGSPSVKTKNDPGGRQSRPGGPDIRWYQALLNLVADRARELIQSAEEADRNPDVADRNALLEQLGQLAKDAKGKAGTQDALTHWIREGKASWHAQERKRIDPASPSEDSANEGSR